VLILAGLQKVLHLLFMQKCRCYQAKWADVKTYTDQVIGLIDLFFVP
jgi:hypothetical protein